MGDYESVWERTKRDFQPWRSGPFGLALAVVELIAVPLAIIFTQSTGQNRPSVATQVAVPILVGGVALLLAVATAYVSQAVAAVKTQRTEAWERADAAELALEAARHETERVKLERDETWVRDRKVQLREAVTRLADNYDVLTAFAEAALKQGNNWRGDGWAGLGLAKSGRAQADTFASFAGLEDLHRAAMRVERRVETLARQGQLQTGSMQSIEIAAWDDLPAYFSAMLAELADAKRRLESAFSDVQEWTPQAPRPR